MKIQETSLLKTSFKDMSVKSLEYLNGYKLIPRDDNILYSYTPLIIGSRGRELYGDLIYRFKHTELEHPILGVDSSIIPLAESIDGYVFAIRGAAVLYFPENDSYKVLIEGPLIFYFNREVLVFLEQYIKSNVLNRVKRVVSYVYAKKILINVYEWIFISNLLNRFSNTIFLIDGVIEPRYLSNKFYSEIYRTSIEQDNYLIGISKRSRYLKYFSDIASILRFLNIEGMIQIEVPGKSFSKVYIGLFRRGGYPFRIDVPRYMDLSVINEVYSSNLSLIGYPEVLKEAHLFSCLRKRDAVILRGILARLGVNIEFSEPYRSIVLGSFEGGVEYEAI